jgi:hypothetical protein
MIEEVLAGALGCMQTNGVGTRFNHHCRTPVKLKGRFFSQSPPRKATYAAKAAHTNKKRAWDLAQNRRALPLRGTIIPGENV